MIVVELLTQTHIHDPFLFNKFVYDLNYLINCDIDLHDKNKERVDNKL